MDFFYSKTEYCLLIFALLFSQGCAQKRQRIKKEKKVTSSENVVLSVKRADKLFQEKKYDAALKIYEEFLTVASQDHRIPSVHFNSGIILFHKKLYSKALKHFVSIQKKYSGFEKNKELKKYLADSYFMISDYYNAVSWYRILFRDYPVYKEPGSILNMANAYYGIGDFLNAQKAYSQILNEPEVKDELADITYKLGLSAFYILEYKASQGYLEKALALDRDIKEKVRILFILGKLATDKSKFFRAFNLFLRAREIIDENALVMFEIKLEVDKFVPRILRNNLNGTELESIYRDLVPKFPSDIALYKYIDYLYSKGMYKKALVEIANFTRIFPEHEETAKVLFIRAKISQYEKPRTTIKIGAIIPLSGKFSVYGEKILHGVQLAVEDINAEVENKIAVIIRDNYGDPANTRRIFTELASLPDVLAIVGPVFSKSVLAIKDLVDEYRVPIITPSAVRDGLPGISDMVFRNCLTNTQESRFIAEFAVQKLCLRTFAIMFLENKYGRHLKKVFEETVTNLGGEVVYTASYKESETDFKKQCRKINSLRPEAIFIADFAERAVMFLPQIAFYDDDEEDDTVEAPAYTFLGTRGWYNPQLISEGGNYIKNVFFPSGFFKGSSEIHVVDFYQNFVAHFTTEPDYLAAQAFDTTNILFHAIKNSYMTRESVAEELFKIKDFPGVSGYSSIQSDGDSEKKLTILTIQKKRFVEVKGWENWECKPLAWQ